ncbi:hypothetical protein H2201_003436 [Coniosporium apollinis]|uniref:Uncharacterized protein n=1 Tax=Coniosporium apollinis TaxID=61459 RepID=A0ABQ9NXP5_9PEZI|nr:hypothetical protein H2201_003436 [Coniosporium apollinis]
MASVWVWQLRARLSFSIAHSPSNCAGQRLFHDGKVIDFEDRCSPVLNDGNTVFSHDGHVVLDDADVEFVSAANVVFLNDATDVFLRDGNVLLSDDGHVFFSHHGNVVYVHGALEFFVTNYDDACFIICARIQPAIYHHSNNHNDYEDNSNTIVEHDDTCLFYDSNIQFSVKRHGDQPVSIAGHECLPVSAASYHYHNIFTQADARNFHNNIFRESVPYYYYYNHHSNSTSNDNNHNDLEPAKDNHHHNFVKPTPYNNDHYNYDDIKR